jgi:hypothetical protein
MLVPAVHAEVPPHHEEPLAYVIRKRIEAGQDDLVGVGVGVDRGGDLR